MLIELQIDYGNKTKLIKTEDILSISSIDEIMIGDVSNRRKGWEEYIIQFTNNSELKVRHLKDELIKNREKLIEYWNKDKKEIIKI